MPSVYEALLFIHVGSALAYFLYHGAVVSVTFAMKRETQAEDREALSGMLDRVYRIAPVSLATLLVSGILLGILGRWWSEGWIWTSISTFFLVGAFMYVAGKAYFWRRFTGVDDEPSSGEQLEDTFLQRLAIGSTMNRHHAKVPAVLTATGLIVMAGIIWLMMFKPF